MKFSLPFALSLVEGFRDQNASTLRQAQGQHELKGDVMITVQKASDGKLKQHINADGIEFFADALPASGGEGAGPDPHALLDAALGACTALTVTMVARRKQIALEDVKVQITHSEEAGVYHLQRQIELVGSLTDEQREYLLGIANKCPIHRALSGRFEIATTLTSQV